MRLQEESALNSPLAVKPEEAGRMTSQSRTAIYKAIAAGELVSFKSGKRRLILVSDLDQWIHRIAAAGQR
ncbi:helix-turn-helix domain-containing protein [Pseudomonas pseudonitroreducens]|uniref:helix-turn-helix domain-containing protein n=1 Tax=Pseudomonas pseudonitroreducens TaxID=2892326 RepID=UPI001F22B037|nr:helix-turn-helix domain-containing protein [Pseudomonas pseudonitroreducens]